MTKPPIKTIPFLSSMSAVDQVNTDNNVALVAFATFLEGGGIARNAAGTIFTILEDGLYNIDVTLRCYGTGATKSYLDFYIMKNGSALANTGLSVDIDTDVPQPQTISFAKLMWLANGETVSIGMQTEDFNQGTGIYKLSHSSVPVTASASIDIVRQS